MIFDLQDKLVMKDYLAAKLYYDLGSYTGNSTYSTTGNNYLSCIVTAQNALKDYPYTKMREDLSILVLRAKYDMAKASVEEKKEERNKPSVLVRISVSVSLQPLIWARLLIKLRLMVRK